MLWFILFVVIITLLAVDLFLSSSRKGLMNFKLSASLSAFYIAAGCLFGLFIYFNLSPEKAQEYFAGFILEKTMSLDNIFVISLVFTFFAIPQHLQHRVLLFGILGVIVLRAIMISLGAALISQFHWVLWIFAVILILTGVKTLYLANNGHNIDIKQLAIYRFLQRKFNITSEFYGNKFMFKKDGKRYYTPLFSALIVIEVMDLIFAFDSIPAIFAVTQDPFIVYSSNIFAILGLRALFFLLAHIVARFYYLKYSLAILLILIGVKLLLVEFIHFPTLWTLSATVLIIAAGILTSLILGNHNTKTSLG